MAGLETLDETSPKDTDPISLGDDSIRETRQKTKTSVGLEHYLDGPHKIPGGTTAQRPAAGRIGRTYYNTDIKAMEYDTGALWSSLADAKARATILWQNTQTAVPQGVQRMSLPFTQVIDDPGGFGSPQYSQIVQPPNSMGFVSAYIELNSAAGGFGFILGIEQWDGSAWHVLAQTWSNISQLGVNTMVDSRWGANLRVAVTSAATDVKYVLPTALGASPRFGYHMLGRTA